jgi:cyclophilin family peptidyl-prolyl cis-trans isomerase
MKHVVFGEVLEGYEEVVKKMEAAGKLRFFIFH